MKVLGLAAVALLWGGCAAAQSQAEGDAILPDPEFESALPRIDNDLNAPLAPLRDFSEPPMPAPDPELSQPLPPLAGFDVTTPIGPDKGEETEDGAALRYRVAVEGLRQVGLEGRFRSLSALDKGDGEAANGAAIAARAREDERLALSILQSEGYYDATVASRVEPVPNGQNQVAATISAVPGPRYLFGTIEITGPATVPPGISREALNLKPGDPIVAADVEAGEANILLRLPQHGYPFATIGKRDVLLDPEIHAGDYALPVDAGPRGSFGGIATDGRLAFDARHVGILSRFDQGDLYDSRKVDDLREAMVATGLFSSVAIEPIRTGRPGPDGTEAVDLRVVQEAGPPRTLAASAGFQTGQGFTLQGSWTHRNLFPPEGALILTGIAGTQQQGATAAFRRNNAGKRDRTVSLSLNALHEDYAAYEAYSASLIGRISRESTPIWQKIWTWSYGFELLTSDERRHDPARVRDDGTYFIVALPAQIGYDRSNSLLDPTRGFRLTARVSPEASKRASGDFDQYARIQLDGSIYYPASESLTLAGRVRLGSIYGAARDSIAPSRRLYAGGGGSVRGFGYQELGPRDAGNNPLGGRSLTEFAAEARYRFGDYGVVGFVDAGQVYAASTPRLSNLRYGIGVGGRMYTNFGPLRVDVATPIDRRKGEAKITIYVSIGQAF